MKQIASRIIKLRCKEKSFLRFSCIANVIVIGILIMIATGIKNITNESLSSNDRQQVESILSSVIFVSIMAIIFFQWIISMQFRALFNSRKQFNDNIRLMGIRDGRLLRVYLREMVAMQPLAIGLGIVLAEATYFILSGILESGQRYIGLFQIIMTVTIHVLVILISITITYRRMVKKSVVDEIRSISSDQEVSSFGIKKRIQLIIGLIILGISGAALIIGERGSDLQSYGLFGELIALFVIFNPVVMLIHKLLLGIAKKRGYRTMVFSEAIALGYMKKSSVVSMMILYSVTMFLGLQMLYRNVRATGADVVDRGIHYAGTAWFMGRVETDNRISNASYGLKYKYKTDNSTWYISGIDADFVDEFENVVVDPKISPIQDELKSYLSDSTFDGILLPNTYIQKSDLGKEITVELDGREVSFHVAGAYYSNNFAHLTFLTSKAYIQDQLGLEENAYNIVYLKDEEDLQKFIDEDGAIIETSESIKAESYEKAVSGTGLVEMVSIVVVLAAILSLINFIMMSSREDSKDIARIRGLGITSSGTSKIYGFNSVMNVIWAVIGAIPTSLLFALIGCLMVVDAGYYKNSLILTPGLMIILTIIISMVSYLVRLAATRKMLITDEYINVLRDMNR